MKRKNHGSAVRGETSKVGKRGAVVVPAQLRRKFGIKEGGLVVTEAREDGILIRPAYPNEQAAEFILSGTIIDEADYQWRCDMVREMGLDPDRIRHYRPMPKA